MSDSKTYAYLRVSTDKQDIDNQRLEILTYANKHNMKIDEFIEVEISSRKDLLKRRITELLGKVNEGDTVIVAELSRIGRSCLLYTSDAADDLLRVDFGGRRIIKKKKQTEAE